MEDLSELALVARRCAELDIVTDPEPVLKGYGLSPEAWLAAQEQLLAEIADDLDRGETERANLFSATYEARRRELLGDEELANDNGALPSSVPETGVVALPAPAQATFQQGLSPVAPAEAEADPDATAMVDNRAVLEAAKTRAVPFDLNAPAIAVPPPKEITEAQSGETQLTEKLDLHAVLASRGIAIGPGAKPPAAPPPAPPVATAEADATAELDTRQLTAMLQAKGILPFDKDAPAVPPPPSPPQEQSGETVLAPQLDLEALRSAYEKAKKK